MANLDMDILDVTAADRDLPGRLGRLPGRPRSAQLCGPAALPKNGARLRLDARDRRLGLAGLPAHPLGSDDRRTAERRLFGPGRTGAGVLSASNATRRAEFVPVNSTRMFTMAGLQTEQPLRRSRRRRTAGDGRARSRNSARSTDAASTRCRSITGRRSRRSTTIGRSKRSCAIWRSDTGYVATFMPKVYPRMGWQQPPRSPQRLGRRAGEADLTPSERGRDFALGHRVAGSWADLLEHAAALTGLGSPTVNSYKRLLPGSWAPANTYWGYGNRSGVARIPGVGERRHIEYRSGDNSCQSGALFGRAAGGRARRHSQPDRSGATVPGRYRSYDGRRDRAAMASVSYRGPCRRRCAALEARRGRRRGGRGVALHAFPVGQAQRVGERTRSTFIRGNGTTYLEVV